MQIASQSKSTTKSRFWNRSFHILPCHTMHSSMRLYHNKNTNHNDDGTSENRSRNNNRSCRLDRKRQKCWRRCYWKSFMASIMIVLLHLTSIECLQGRQEGEFEIVFKNTLNVFDHKIWSWSFKRATLKFIKSVKEEVKLTPIPIPRAYFSNKIIL